MSSSLLHSTALDPATETSSSAQPVSTDGRLISMVMNTGSGHHAAGHEQLAEQLMTYFSQQGFKVDLYLLTEARQLREVIRLARAKHAREGGVIVAAGGDGTLNSVAQELKHTQIRMGIIPLGTFNYVARALDIPLEPMAAAQVIVEGMARSVHVGTINDYIYLNNASIGLYPKIIEQRELHNARYGRFRVVAMVSGFAVLMREQLRLKLRMTIDGAQTPIETPLVFFGNNQLQLQDMKLTLADCVAQGKLAVVAITPLTRWKMIKLIHQLQLGTFEQAAEVRSFCADQIKIESRTRLMKVALDGEIVKIQTPLVFKVAHNALQVMVPYAVTSV